MDVYTVDKKGSSSLFVSYMFKTIQNIKKCPNNARGRTHWAREHVPARGNFFIEDQITEVKVTISLDIAREDPLI